MDPKESNLPQPMDTNVDLENNRTPDNELEEMDANVQYAYPDDENRNIEPEDAQANEQQAVHRTTSAPVERETYHSNERLTPPQNTRYLSRRLQRATLMSPERVRHIMNNTQFSIPVSPGLDTVNRSFEIGPESRSLSDSNVSSGPVDRSQTESLRQSVMSISDDIERILSRSSSFQIQEDLADQPSLTMAVAENSVPRVPQNVAGPSGRQQESSSSSRSEFSPMLGCDYGTDTTVTTPEEFRYESAEDVRNGSMDFMNGNTTPNPNLDRRAPLPDDSSDEETDNPGRRRYPAQSSHLPKRKR